MQNIYETGVLKMPPMDLPAGTWSLIVHYSADEDQSVQFSYNQFNDRFLMDAGSGKAILSKTREETVWQFHVWEDVEALSVQVNYKGPESGELLIKNMIVVENNNARKQQCVFFAFLFLIADLCFLLRKRFASNGEIVFILAGIVLFTSLPLFAKGLNQGHDLMFHLTRIEGIATELSAGSFPVRMSSYWMDGYGYPVSVYYPDILLYIPALLRLAGFSVMFCYKCYVLFVNTATTVIAFYSFQGMFKSRKIAYITTILYTTASYRLINVYIRAAVGEYSAMIFFPLIALAMYRIYTDDAGEGDNVYKNSLLLTLGMTGVIETHILSVEMVVIILTVFCVMQAKMTIQWKRLRVLLLAVVQTILLNLFFLIPFLDYYKHVPVKVLDPNDPLLPIGMQGAYLLQYFGFFQSPYGESVSGVADRFAMTPGIFLMLALVIGVALWILGKATGRMKLMIVLSVFLLLLASDVFPWRFLQVRFSLWRQLAHIQFPWRFLAPVTILLTILAGELVNQLQDYIPLSNRMVFSCILASTACILFVFFSQYMDGVNQANYYDDAEFDRFHIMSGEYLRLGNDERSVPLLDGKIRTGEDASVSVLERETTALKLHCVNGTKENVITLPVFHYPGYHVTDRDGRELEIFDGPQKEISFCLPSGYDSEVSISYQSPWYWRLSEVISLLSLIVTVILFFLNRKRKSGITV